MGIRVCDGMYMEGLWVVPAGRVVGCQGRDLTGPPSSLDGPSLFVSCSGQHFVSRSRPRHGPAIVSCRH
jgi:hypothetical protein